jgi:hypothetical protein
MGYLATLLLGENAFSLIAEIAKMVGSVDTVANL